MPFLLQRVRVVADVVAAARCRQWPAALRAARARRPRATFRPPAVESGERRPARHARADVALPGRASPRRRPSPNAVGAAATLPHHQPRPPRPGERARGGAAAAEGRVGTEAAGVAALVWRRRRRVAPALAASIARRRHL